MTLEITDVAITIASTNVSQTICQKPLIPVIVHNSRFPFNCSPTCMDDQWAMESKLVAFDVVTSFTLIFAWICCMVMFITLPGVPDL